VTLPAFQRLVDEHWYAVARLAHALAGPADGDDVAQQAWTQALAAYPSLRTTQNLRGWLLTITARCATDLHRVRRRRPVPVDELPEGAAAVPTRADGPGGGDPADLPGPPDGELWSAVRSLPERQRTALVLRYVADLDHAEIARALGTTPGATRRLVSDALAALRRTLPDRSRTPDPVPAGTARTRSATASRETR
jgi:RNA polymerase sigma factor (sigma-70 family)